MNKNIFYKFFLACPVLLLLSCKSIFACSCVYVDTVKSAFGNADAVIAGRIEKVESQGETIEGKFVWFKQTITVKVLKSYKNVRTRKIIISQPNTSCNGSFADDKGKDFLFYLRFDKKNNTYQDITCGRSSLLNQASDDLSWLKDLPKSLERTRISGTIRLYDWGREVKFIRNVSGIKIKIFNRKNSYEAITNKNGMYEIWDIPTGKYKVKAMIPKHFTVQNQDIRGDVEYKKIGENDYDLKDFTIEIKTRNCVGIDYDLSEVNE